MLIFVKIYMTSLRETFLSEAHTRESESFSSELKDQDMKSTVSIKVQTDSENEIRHSSLEPTKVS